MTVRELPVRDAGTADGPSPAGPGGPRGRAGRPKGLVRLGPVAVAVRPRAVVVALGLLALTVVASVATLTLGRLGIPLAELGTALSGGAEGRDAFVLERLRGPRLVVALGTGCALGLSGALFQSATRNPLGSPDVIGVAAGAGAGASAAALFLTGTVPVPVGALVGAVLAMVLVYLSTGTGFRNPGRLVVAGIGVAAICQATTQYVVYAMERDNASALTAYINGSLSSRSWEDATTIGLVLLVAAVPLLLLARPLGAGEMGDDIAQGLGAEPRRTKTCAVVLAIVLAAGAVAVAGPIAFIALTAPQVAKRLTRLPGPHLLLSGVTGALLLVVADLCAQQLPLFENLPVGIYTMAIGGAYLGLLILGERRRGRL
ncbi:iron chelate uptake ABC transporter family permease subunit [Streptomyces sp. NPDC020875]|uniref:FecCD family ABC transporter permease n=1 Tax=Streptomyces sp. NPDC020875 TaxID=3154898 RepID=UPI00340DBDF2